MAQQTLTTGQIAKHCRVNYQTVIRWIKRGRLKAYQLPGRGDHRVEVADFLDFLKSNNLPVPADFETRKKRVLVVDDDPNMTRAIERLLRRDGYETTTASNGFEAGALLGTFVPDLVTLDLQMPGLGGMDVIRFVRQSDAFRHQRILVVSGQSSKQLDHAVKDGADAHLKKPFKNELFLQKVHALVGKSR